MNTAIAKKVLMTLLVLIVASTMASCDLFAPAETGSSVDVVMGGIEGTSGARGIGGNATWVSIMVVDSSGVQKGSGSLA